jgi:putative sterol carrier protein
MMGFQAPITVCSREEQGLNGLGMMMQQYLEQNLSDFPHKSQEGRRIRGSFTVEMEGGVPSTIIFQGGRILIQNGVAAKPDLHLKGSYMVMSKVIAGQANPFSELLRKKIKMASFPRRPLQCFRVLRFLRIPPELLDEKTLSGKKRLRMAGWGLGFAAMAVLIYILFLG